MPLITICECTDAQEDFCRNDVPVKRRRTFEDGITACPHSPRVQKPVSSCRTSSKPNGANTKEAGNEARRAALVDENGEWLSLPRPISLIKEGIHLSIMEI